MSAEAFHLAIQHDAHVGNRRGEKVDYIIYRNNLNLQTLHGVIRDYGGLISKCW